MAKNSELKRKPTAKKEFSLSDFKKKVGVDNVPNKPLEWLECSPAIKQATGLPGIPIGYTTLARGYSNTGKSTIACEAAVAAQKKGILPIIIDTENNLGRKRLKMMGLDVDNAIFIDNTYLLDNYGKKKNKDIGEASIEDMADCIKDFLNMQENGELDINIIFIIDSLGTLDCIRSIKAQEKDGTNNNMWNAGSFEFSFKYLLNNRIPTTRKETSKYTNTILGVQKIWLDSMQGAGTIRHKGGEAFFYGARLIFHFGGIVSHGSKKITATSKKRDVAYGIETKIGIIKNQIDGDLGGIAMEGKIISTPHGFIGSEKEDIENYKKENIQYFRDILGDEINPDELTTKYSNMDDSVDLDDFTSNIEEFENKVNQ